MSVCESKIKTDNLILQKPCKSETSFNVSHQAKVLFGRFPLIVTTTYQVKVEPLGFALGRHLYSVPLTPGEEVEIEIFRSAKVERELSQQYSTEVEFTEEYSQACKYEWSKEKESNFKVSGDVGATLDLVVIEFGAKGDVEYSETEKTFERVISEVVHSTKLRVNRKFDIHVGLKTEVENRYRSTRKIQNPNLCRSLTYNYFQLMRKVEVTITRTRVRFDWLLKPRPMFESPIRAVIRNYVMPSMEIRKLVATREERSELAQPVYTQPVLSTSMTSAATVTPSPIGASTSPQLETSTPAIKTLVHPIISEPPVLELTKERVLAKMNSVKAFRRIDEKRKLEAAIDKLRQRFPVNKKIVERKQICINTNSMHVESMMGICLACEGHKLDLAKVELEKTKVELDKMKKNNSDNGP